ncbi:hypothetical protein [Ornithinimicrobium cerasi]|uniref:Uncharacterized protein n=1 Tax=Ornithinimicrobium cerasi TaxID=2248773 RepID=A0A285VJN0_9MICO|nr:hypothetical protein [Ornithinimicrobium cerasi]SOC53748.1 hypothetical protein SAMN05421879_102106 [Ornithinimicrobium cerasi]
MHKTFSTALTLALAGTALAAAPSAGHPAAPPTSGDGCEVRVMAWPGGVDDGTVMDIEVVPGLGTVYYGSYLVDDPDRGMARRAVVWYGLDAQPVRVGPAGTAYDIALELTPSGKINGQSVVDETGRERAWVQDLRTGKVTWVDTPEDASGIYVRRINDRGEAAGTVFGEENAKDAVVWWPRVDRPGRVLPAPGKFGYAMGWGINNFRDVVGFFDHYVEQYDAIVTYGVTWDRHGSPTLLASNPGNDGDSFPRVINNAGQAAGGAWYGDFFEGHFEAARWPSPDVIEPLGLLPGGGYSEVYGQSEGGWTVGLADHFDPDSPGALPWGAVDHSVLWTDDLGAARVLPSPYAVEQGQDDWRDWFGGAAHGVNTGLDQVGTSSHDAWRDDGTIRFAPTVYVNASQCGELVPTSHTAFWEEPADEGMALSSLSSEVSTSRVAQGLPAQPRAYHRDAVRERIAELP